LKSGARQSGPEIKTGFWHRQKVKATVGTAQLQRIPVMVDGFTEVFLRNLATPAMRKMGQSHIQ